jgi:ADP-ribosylation factor-like protein 5B
MGIMISKLWKRLFKMNREFKILILGLANAGKTTVLYQLHLGKVITTQPTIGSNVEEVRNKNVRFQVWDLGGQESLRAAWSTYFQGTHGVIFVVDSSDRKNDEVSKMELRTILNHEDLRTAVLLVMANKQDVEGSMNAAELTEKLKLNEIKTHEWHIQSTSATKGEGLKEGVDWITDRLIEQKPPNKT